MGFLDGTRLGRNLRAVKERELRRGAFSDIRNRIQADVGLPLQERFAEQDRRGFSVNDVPEANRDQFDALSATERLLSTVQNVDQFQALIAGPREAFESALRLSIPPGSRLDPALREDRLDRFATVASAQEALPDEEELVAGLKRRGLKSDPQSQAAFLDRVSVKRIADTKLIETAQRTGKAADREQSRLEDGAKVLARFPDENGRLVRSDTTTPQEWLRLNDLQVTPKRIAKLEGQTRVVEAERARAFSRERRDRVAGAPLILINPQDAGDRRSVTKDNLTRIRSLVDQGFLPGSFRENEALEDVFPGITKIEASAFRSQKTGAREVISLQQQALAMIDANPESVGLSGGVSRFLGAFEAQLKNLSALAGKARMKNPETGEVTEVGFEEFSKKFQGLADSITSPSLIGGIAESGRQNALLSATMLRLAYQGARAAGNTGNSLSDRDVANFLKQVGAASQDPEAMKGVLRQYAFQTVNSVRLSHKTLAEEGVSIGEFPSDLAEFLDAEDPIKRLQQTGDGADGVGAANGTVNPKALKALSDATDEKLLGRIQGLGTEGLDALPQAMREAINEELRKRGFLGAQ